MDENGVYSSDSETEVMFMYYIWKKKYAKTEKRRKTWVRQMFLDREKSGEFHRLVPQLFRERKKFRSYFGMDIETYNILSDTVKPYCTIGNTNFRASIQFEERLVVTIRYLMTGLSFHSLSYLFRISHNKISHIVNEMMPLIFDALESKYLKFPTTQEFVKISEEFYVRTKFPNCLGAIDARTIRVRKQFGQNEPENSTVLIAAVDAEHKFIAVEVSSAKDLEGRFEKLLFKDRLKVPQERKLRPENKETSPYVFVGDTAFRLTENLLKPYPKREDTDKTRNYHLQLSNVHKFVDETYALLAGRFRIFELNNLPVYTDRVDRTIKCACVLHNMIVTIENFSFEEETLIKPGSFLPISNSRHTSQSTKGARTVRDFFSDYFQQENVA